MTRDEWQRVVAALPRRPLGIYPDKAYVGRWLINDPCGNVVASHVEEAEASAICTVCNEVDRLHAERDEIAARHASLISALCRISATAVSLVDAQAIARRAMNDDEQEADEGRDVGLWERADDAERAAARLESERDALRAALCSLVAGMDNAIERLDDMGRGEHADVLRPFLREARVATQRRAS